MTEKEIKDRLWSMATAGHCTMVLGDVVVMPAEAEDYFTEEEMSEVYAYLEAQIRRRAQEL